MNDGVPVITVDGPSGSGKGTLSRRVAEQLGWHFLDSGAIYRVLALAAIKNEVSLEDEQALSLLANQLDVAFDHVTARVSLESEDVTQALRTESCGGAASQVAAFPAVRVALLERQRAFKMYPGLVADGRDMGTVVFPDANLKIFLEATPEERAKRRLAQLKGLGIDVSLDGLLAEIALRDERDRQRAVSPLVPARDAVVIDTTSLSIPEVFQAMMAEAKRRDIVPETI